MKYKSDIKIFMASIWVTVLLPLSHVATAAEGFSDTWHVVGDWYSTENARLDTWNEKRLIGDRGEGVLINGRIGKAQSLVTKRRDYRDVEVHLEFMVAKGSNSGVIFHGNYEIQILDSHGIAKPTAGHCGGVYPRAKRRSAAGHCVTHRNPQKTLCPHIDFFARQPNTIPIQYGIVHG